MEILDEIIEIIRSKEGKSTRYDILKKLGEWGERDIRQASNGAKLRKSIQRIRRRRISGKEILLSDPKGYWLSSDTVEIRRFIVRLTKRGQEHLETARMLEEHLHKIEAAEKVINIQNGEQEKKRVTIRKQKNIAK